MKAKKSAVARPFEALRSGIVRLLEEARRTSVRAVNSLMTATYWEIGRRIVEYEQDGRRRARYGRNQLVKLSADLIRRFGRGFSVDNLENMRRFYLAYKDQQISETPSRKLARRNSETVSRNSSPGPFPLPWSHYVKLLCVESPQARAFYEAEALRGGWSVRQLDRQISTLFYERTALSRDKAAMLRKGAKALPGERPTVEEEIKDPLVLEFLGLKDEYSESTLEEALILHLEHFLLELGNDFTFVARQKRLRVGSEWYRIDLLLFHRRLRCLVVIDLKVGRFSHADVGQMNLYLNYIGQNWTHPEENPPVGLILCSKGDQAVVQYALGNLSDKVFTAEYRLVLPNEKELAAAIAKSRKALDIGKLSRRKISETPSRKLTAGATAAGSPRSSRPPRSSPPPSRRRALPPTDGPA